MTDDSVLLSDQVFQLNTFLWALQDLPKGGPTDPVLGKAGYYLRAIERSVIMSARGPVITALTSLLGTIDRSPSRPDLWLGHSSDAVDVVIELKAHGFSEESSNKRQALKIIASAADLAPSLAESSRHSGHVIYATVASDAEALSETLRGFARMLESKNVPAAPTAVIGFSMETDGVALLSHNPEDLPTPAADALASPAIVLRRDGKNDLHPLYFVPWVPGIHDSQNPELRSAGLAELTARVLSHALAKIGQASAPFMVVLDGLQLLSAATFEVFDHWSNSERRQFGMTVADILVKALRSAVNVSRRGDHIVEVDLPDSAARDSAIDGLEQADPADPASNLETAGQLSLDLGAA